jgi:PhoPQ-activated pathogenicity-related protein
MRKRYLHLLLGFALLLVSCCDVFCQTPVTPETALQAYLNNDDNRYEWKLKDSYSLADVKAFSLMLTSQQWHEYIWTHELIILVPSEIKYDGALLFIAGGSNKKGVPNWIKQDDKFVQSLAAIASKNKGIVAVLRQTPNQPLYGDLTEDALISSTLHHFKEDGDYSWPLLFPMVKGAVKAMDAVQEFSKLELNHRIARFVVSGASKRGWTTWLTGAIDQRIAAIAPMVIDVLNMPVNLDYQVKMYNGYSEQIEDYVKLEIPQTMHSEKGRAITTMVDPYAYRKNLTMPKMIFMGTNDEYWTVDAVKNYIDSIPGSNFIDYVPNVGHDLGDKRQALATLSAFFRTVISNGSHTRCEWDIAYNKKGITVKVTESPELLISASLWSADSEDTDFRDEHWAGKEIPLKGKSALIQEKVSYPEKGYRAFYVDLKYKDSNGDTYSKCSRMFLADEDEVFVR